jgi:hypothetical protein
MDDETREAIAALSARLDAIEAAAAAERANTSRRLDALADAIESLSGWQLDATQQLKRVTSEAVRVRVEGAEEMDVASPLAGANVIDPAEIERRREAVRAQVEEARRGSVPGEPVEELLAGGETETR